MIKEILLVFIALASISSCNSASGENKSRAQKGVDTETVSENKLEQQQQTYIGNITGEVQLKGSFTGTGLDGKTIYLYETESDDVYEIDSTKIKDDAFDFDKKEYPIGVYALGFESSDTQRIVLNPQEEEVEIQFIGNRISPNYKVVSSDENRVWKDYSTSEKRISQQLSGLKRRQASSQDIQAKEYELKDLRNSVVSEHPETFTAKVVAHLESPNPTVKAEYWKDIDFSDDSYVRSTVLKERIQDYMIKFSGGTETGFLNSIDYIVGLAKAGGNDRVLETVLYTMMEGFYSSNKEDMSLYILDNYVNEETCGADLSDVLASKAEGIRRLQVGHKPKDFTVSTVDGGSLNLYDEVAKNQYTLLFFWASWCHKCETEIPVLKEIYSTYKGQDFDVIGFSVDQSATSWENAIAEKSIPWHNVSELGGWTSPTPKEYRVTQTPTMFLLNNKGEIVLKPNRVREVESFLKQNL